LKIYIASKTNHAARWRALRSSGVPVSCTWIDEAGAYETLDWPDLWERCIREAAGADVFILYCEEGEVLKGAFVELGSAACRGKAYLWWVGPVEGNVPRMGRLHFADSINEVLGYYSIDSPIPPGTAKEAK